MWHQADTLLTELCHWIYFGTSWLVVGNTCYWLKMGCFMFHVTIYISGWLVPKCKKITTQWICSEYYSWGEYTANFVLGTKTQQICMSHCCNSYTTWYSKTVLKLRIIFIWMIYGFHVGVTQKTQISWISEETQFLSCVHIPSVL